MGCTESKIEALSSQKNPKALIPYNREAPLTLTIEDIRMQTYTVRVTLGTTLKDLYVQVNKLRGSECSLYYAGEWLQDQSEESLAEYGMLKAAKLDLIDKAE